MQDLEQTIRGRAYDLWIADGCRDGFADRHWLVAQREVLASSLAAIARVMVDDAQAKSVVCLSEIKLAHTDDEVRREMA
jgi:Protein of unknown function (DUF2934)